MDEIERDGPGLDLAEDAFGEEVEDSTSEAQEPTSVDLLYFKDMSAAPLPSRDRELEVSARIEEARCKVRALIEKPPAGLRRKLEAYQRLRREGRPLLHPCPDAFALDLAAELERWLAESGLPAREAAPFRTFARSLEAAITELDGAKNDLTESNLRLVIHIANRFQQHQLPLMDLIQEGNLGLMKAVEKFDATRGFRFSTYAVWWIRQYIKRAIENHGTAVRAPIYVQEARRRLVRSSRDLGRRLGRKPELWEVAADEGMSVERVEELLSVKTDAVSLDEPTAGGEGRPMVDFLEDADSISPFSAASESELSTAIARVLSQLTPREEKILRLRFGIGTEDPSGRTLREVSRLFNLTHERIRQIEAKALQRLKVVMAAEQLEALAAD